MKEFNSFVELVNYLNSLTSQQEQINEIVNYFIQNVQFDYVMLENINEIVTKKFAKYVDALFPNTSEQSRNKALSYIKNSSNVSNEYWNRIKTNYLNPTINEKGEKIYKTMYDVINEMKADIKEDNGLLKKGIAENITSFAKKLCEAVGIRCVEVKGISSGKMNHSWLDIEINNQELFYDITYAIYTRDNFCGLGKRYKIEEWIGITPKQLYKNQPSRIIKCPKGFNLEYLGLNNLPLFMKEFFDAGA